MASDDEEMYLFDMFPPLDVDLDTSLSLDVSQVEPSSDTIVADVSELHRYCPVNFEHAHGVHGHVYFDQELSPLSSPKSQQTLSTLPSRKSATAGDSALPIAAELWPSIDTPPQHTPSRKIDIFYDRTIDNLSPFSRPWSPRRRTSFVKRLRAGGVTVGFNL